MGYDRKTAALLGAIAFGLPFLGWAEWAGHLPFWAASLLATLLMNLTFTVWHETSHANFSRAGWVNHAAGILASFLSVYPGYFARRREHLAHHRWEGDPAHDPVFPRIQDGPIAFFFRLTWLTIRRAGAIQPSFLPLSGAQKRIDRLTVGAALFLIGLSLQFGFFRPVLAVLLLPRLAVFYLHAFYICYLPHAKREGGFEKYRVRTGSGFLWRAFTAGQWAHGVHHRWPNVRWHEYASHQQRLAAEESA